MNENIGNRKIDPNAKNVSVLPGEKGNPLIVAGIERAQRTLEIRRKIQRLREEMDKLFDELLERGIEEPEEFEFVTEEEKSQEN